MMTHFVQRLFASWAAAVPLLAVTGLAIAWGERLSGLALWFAAVILAASILAAVHHAEVVAHKVGEPFGSLVLAVAVTVVEVGLIVTVMIGAGAQAHSLARDTVFSAVMISCNGIVGLSLLVGTLRKGAVLFNAEGAGAALATVTTLATLSLVVPTFTTTTPGPRFSAGQLAFAAVTALVLYLLFVTLQTGRHRDYFLPVAGADGVKPELDRHADPPSTGKALVSAGLLLVALVGVVGNAKLVSPAIQTVVSGAGLPLAVVGVVIALFVLLPETLAAVRAARRGLIQTSLNLAYGSAIASIGLTIPTSPS